MSRSACHEPAAVHSPAACRWAATATPPPAGSPAGRPGAAESARANRRWWDAAAPAYLAEHGADLGDADFLWCPEGLREADAHLLGDVAGRRVLEIGCGSAPCSRWLRRAGADVVALDLSAGMLARAAELNRSTGIDVPLLQADAGALPLADRLGGRRLLGVRRAAVRRRRRARAGRGGPGAAARRPVRRLGEPPDALAVPRLPRPRGPAGRRPPTSTARPTWRPTARGRTVYVEHHRTVGDWVRAVVGAGLVLEDLVEPEWTPGRTQEWGQWSPDAAR